MKIIWIFFQQPFLSYNKSLFIWSLDMHIQHDKSKKKPIKIEKQQKFVHMYMGSNSLVSNVIFEFNQGVQMIQWHFKSKGYKDFVSYSSIMVTAYSWPINEDTKKRLFNLKFNIKKITL